MTTSRPKRKTVPLAKRGRKARLRADRILYGRSRRGPRPIYNREVHPAGLIAYFRERLEAIKEVERVRTKQRDVKFVQEPVRPPTLAGYAASIGIDRRTLWQWGEQHEEFEDALEFAKTIQEEVLCSMGSVGAYNPQVVIFMLKNLQGWADKIDQRIKGTVSLHFDAQDAEA
jgi:hypothetical protein